jgi:transposase-like protein
MPQHFLLSRAAKTLKLAHAMRLSNEEAETAFMGIRWQDTNGKPVCPHCDCRIAYANPRPNGSLRWTCKACRRDFTLTSGTIFASRKMPVQTYLGAIAIFCNEVKGKAALALSRAVSRPRHIL